MDPEGMTDRTRIFRVYLLTGAGVLIWIAAIIGAPYLRNRGIRGADFIYACFAPICHQIPSRSFFFQGFPLAVCARCFGIYAGFAAGYVFYPFRRGFSAVQIPRLKSFLLVSAPIILDTGGNFLRLWDTGLLFRFLTGVFWGFILPFYFITGVSEILISSRFQRTASKSSLPPN